MTSIVLNDDHGENDHVGTRFHCIHRRRRRRSLPSLVVNDDYDRDDEGIVAGGAGIIVGE